MLVISETIAFSFAVGATYIYYSWLQIEKGFKTEGSRLIWYQSDGYSSNLIISRMLTWTYPPQTGENVNNSSQLWVVSRIPIFSVTLWRQNPSIFRFQTIQNIYSNKYSTLFCSKYFSFQVGRKLGFYRWLKIHSFDFCKRKFQLWFICCIGLI